MVRSSCKFSILFCIFHFLHLFIFLFLFYFEVAWPQTWLQGVFFSSCERAYFFKWIIKGKKNIGKIISWHLGKEISIFTYPSILITVTPLPFLKVLWPQNVIVKRIFSKSKKKKIRLFCLHSVLLRRQHCELFSLHHL